MIYFFQDIKIRKTEDIKGKGRVVSGDVIVTSDDDQDEPKIKPVRLFNNV